MMLGGAMIFGWIFWLAAIVAVVWLVAYATNPRRRAGGPGSKHMEILKERFAKGEINREQYEEGRRVLMNP